MAVRTVLAQGKLTVNSVLQVIGLNHAEHFQNYHRVLNHTVWSSVAVNQVPLGLLINAIGPTGTIELGLDDTSERRRGAKVRAKGIYRAPVRSSHSHCVKANGLGGLSLMQLAPIPWAKWAWALPFLTVLDPSARHHEHSPRANQELTDWARQVLQQMRRWLPG